MSTRSLEVVYKWSEHLQRQHLPIMRTRRHRTVGTLKKHGAEADRLQLVHKKVCSQAHQIFMFDSDEAFPKVVHGAVAENLGACHPD